MNLKYIVAKVQINRVGELRATQQLMSFGIYLLGYAIFIIGLAVGAHMLHLPPKWIGVGVLIFVGLGILKAVSSTRQRDPN